MLGSCSRAGVILTHREMPNRAAVCFYNKREQRSAGPRRGAGGEDGPPLLSSFSPQGGVAGAKALSVLAYNLGNFAAATGVAQANRELVADELAATAGEDGRTAGETCPLLLADWLLPQKGI